MYYNKPLQTQWATVLVSAVKLAVGGVGNLYGQIIVSKYGP